MADNMSDTNTGCTRRLSGTGLYTGHRPGLSDPALSGYPDAPGTVDPGQFTFVLRKRRGMTLIEIMITVIIIAIIFAYAFVNAGNYTEKSKYARVGEDIMTLTSAIAISNLESAGDWKGVEAVSTTGKTDAFANLFTGDDGKATAQINKKLSKSTFNIKDPWGQPYDLVVKDEDGKKVMYILCRSGTEAVNSITEARKNKFEGNREMGTRVTLD